MSVIPDFDHYFREPEESVFLFGKYYRWHNEDGPLQLQPLSNPPVIIGEWNCCGRPKIL